MLQFGLTGFPPDSSRLTVKHPVATGIALSAVQPKLCGALHCIIQARQKDLFCCYFGNSFSIPPGVASLSGQEPLVTFIISEGRGTKACLSGCAATWGYTLHLCRSYARICLFSSPD